MTERQKTRRVTQENRLVRVSILLVHDHVDDWVDAGAQVDHDVPEDVQTRPVHVLIENFRDRDRQIARDEREEDDEHHHRDSHLVAFLLRLTFVFDLRRFRQMESISVSDVVLG